MTLSSKMATRGSCVWWIVFVTSLLAFWGTQVDFWPKELNWSTLISFVVFIAVTIYSLLKTGWVIYNHINYRKHPFKMEYQRLGKWEGKRPVFKRLNASLGEFKFQLRIQPKRPCTFKRLHVRLLDKEDVEAHFPPVSVVSLSDMSARGQGLISGFVTGLRQDDTNGIEGNLQEEWECTPDESLFLILTIKANSAWSGFVMFQAPTSEKRRGYAYLPLKAGE
ncbi:MAG: hypothetical protein HYX79_05740 [Chloroflexi bacterium]|nr:hypothetical protein [Chloroflexota bacterium]